jgi:hypothetical protein
MASAGEHRSRERRYDDPPQADVALQVSDQVDRCERDRQRDTDECHMSGTHVVSSFV